MGSCALPRLLDIAMYRHGLHVCVGVFPLLLTRADSVPAGWRRCRRGASPVASCLTLHGSRAVLLFAHEISLRMHGTLGQHKPARRAFDTGSCNAPACVLRARPAVSKLVYTSLDGGCVRLEESVKARAWAAHASRVYRRECVGGSLATAHAEVQKCSLVGADVWSNVCKKRRLVWPPQSQV